MTPSPSLRQSVATPRTLCCAATPSRQSPLVTHVRLFVCVLAANDIDDVDDPKTLEAGQEIARLHAAPNRRRASHLPFGVTQAPSERLSRFHVEPRAVLFHVRMGIDIQVSFVGHPRL